MRTIPLSEVINLDPGESVPQTKGVIKATFARKSGVTNGKEWSVQNIVLQEGAAEIKCTLWNRDDVTAMKGRQVWLISHKSQKDGKLVGLTIKENTYTNKGGKEVTEKVLDVGEKAEIARSDAPQEQPEPADQDGENVDDSDDGDLGPQKPPVSSTKKPDKKPDWQPLGITVGMAINNVCASLTALGKPLEPKTVWEMASDILRVTKSLESGTLAAPWSERQTKRPETE